MGPAPPVLSVSRGFVEWVVVLDLSRLWMDLQYHEYPSIRSHIRHRNIMHDEPLGIVAVPNSCKTALFVVFDPIPLQCPQP